MNYVWVKLIGLPYTAKSEQLCNVDGNMIEQCLAAYFVLCCQQFCSALSHTIEA